MIAYEITVEGHLHKNRLEDFEGLSALSLPDGKTRLLGALPDQTALFSVLNRIRDMNLQLASVQQQTTNMEES